MRIKIYLSPPNIKKIYNMISEKNYVKSSFSFGSKHFWVGSNNVEEFENRMHNQFLVEKGERVI